jgi:hypothetical protein
MWWARGGRLHGQSPTRLAFLKQILDTAPREGLEPIDKWQDLQTAGKAGEYYLIYFGKQSPAEFIFELPRDRLVAGMEFKAEIIDTWNMTVTPVEETFKIVTDSTYRYRAEGLKTVKLPGKPYIALRIRRVGGVLATAQQEVRNHGD